MADIPAQRRPASATSGGELTTGAQDIAGPKNFVNISSFRAETNLESAYPVIIKNLSSTKITSFGAYAMDTNTGGYTFHPPVTLESGVIFGDSVDSSVDFVDGDTTDLVGTGNHAGTIFYKVIGNMVFAKCVTTSDANVYTYSIPITILEDAVGGTLGGGYRGPSLYRTGNNTYYEGEVRTTATAIVFEKTGSTSVSSSFIWILPPMHIV